MTAAKRKGRPGHLERVVQEHVATDPVVQAITAPIVEAVLGELFDRVPLPVAWSTAQVAERLSCSPAQVRELLAEGRLERIAGPKSSITEGSILRLVGLEPVPAESVAGRAS